MQKATKKEVLELIDQLEEAANTVNGAKELLEAIRDAKQEEFDELSEKQQEGAKGEKLTADIEELETLLNDEGWDGLTEGVEALQEVLKAA